MGVSGFAAALRSPGSLTREFGRAIVGSAGLRLVGMALGFLVGVQLARYLGVEGYGVYGYAMAVATLASTIALFGLQLLAVRETAFAVQRQDWAGLAGFLRWAWLRAVVLAALLAVTAGAWLALSGPGSAMPLPLWGGLFVFFSAAVALAGPMLRGLGNIVGGQSLDTVLVPGAQCLLLLAAMLALGSLTAADALGISVLATALAAGVGLVWLWRRVPAPARTAPPRIDGRHWHRAMLPMGATTVMRALDAQLPMLVLGAMVLAADLGTFRVALASMLLVNFPYTLVSVLTPPLMARVHAMGAPERLQRLASAATMSTLVPTIGITLILFLFGEWLIAIVFGAGYVGAWPLLMILAVGGIANSFFGVTPGVLFATGHERKVTTGFTLGFLVLAVALFFLVPRLGITGAAWAVVAGVSVREICLWRYCRRDAAVEAGPWAAPRVLLRQ